MKRKMIIIILFILALLPSPAQAQIGPIDDKCDPAWICPYRVYVPMVVQNGRETVSKR